jgi:hypothetical protein
MAAWDAYLTAAQRLDAVRRDAAAVAASQANVVQAARQELATVRHRLALQSARLTDIVRRAGVTPPTLVPSHPADEPVDPAAATLALRAARADLDAADSLLSQVDSPHLGRGPLAGWSPALRNLLVYGGFALVVLNIQVALFLSVSGTAGSVAALLCGAVLPIVGYAASRLTIGLLYRGRGRVDHTPVLGAAISALPLVLLCAGLGGSALLR